MRDGRHDDAVRGKIVEARRHELQQALRDAALEVEVQEVVRE